MNTINVSVRWNEADIIVWCKYSYSLILIVTFMICNGVYAFDQDEEYANKKNQESVHICVMRVWGKAYNRSICQVCFEFLFKRQVQKVTFPLIVVVST